MNHAYFVANFWSFESVNVNENDDELDSEDVDIEENPLDESELIHDYKIESLQLYDSGKTWSYGAQNHVQSEENDFVRSCMFFRESGPDRDYETSSDR